MTMLADPTTTAGAPAILSLETCDDTSLAGGKAVNLGAMLRAGFPVPGGFAVTTAAYRAARDRAACLSPSPGTPGEGRGGGSSRSGDTSPTGPLPSPPPEYRERGPEGGITGLPPELADAVCAAYRAMGSGPVAVRSSATAEDMAGASMAGQYDTFLHVRDEAALLDAVARCWLSLDTPRTRSYLREHGIDISAVAMAVVVQRLVRADVAGVLFTANPRTGSRTEMLAEACWGLGEALVSGRVQPDVLRVDRATGDLLDHRVADKRVMIPFDGDGEVETPEHLRRTACLSAPQVRELWRLGRKAADHFGGEQDIEWALQDGTLYLLQSRPVTTLAEADACARIVAETKAALAADLAAGKGPWVRHNLGETLPHPTPLTWSVMRRFMSGAGGFGAMYRLAGFEPSAGCCRDGFLRLIGGRVYMDASAAAGMFFERFPFRYDVDALRTNPDAAQAPPTIPTGSFKDRFKAGRRIGRINADLAKQAEDLDRRLRHDVFPELLAYVRREKARDLASMSDAQLAALWRQRDARVMGHYAPLTLLPSLVEGMVLADLRAFVAEVAWDEDADELARLLSSSPVPNMTLLADAGLYDVARGRRTIHDWLARFGHRAAGEFDLSTPRWREQPGLVRATAERLAGGQDPMALHERHAASVRARAEALRDRMGRADAEEFARRLDRVWRYIVFREDGKYYLMLGYDLLRDVAVEAGRRLRIGDGVFYLREEEMLAALATNPEDRHSCLSLGTQSGLQATRAPSLSDGKVPEARGPQWDPSDRQECLSSVTSLPQLIASRKLVHRAEARASLPHLIDAAALPALGEPPKVDAAGTHEAFAVSAGVAVGPARVVMSPHEAGDLGTGYVLVCPSTDPNWTPLFVNAAALVLECGGTLSHGAVVAREMGLPAVVLPDATRILADGQRVRVDGHHGTVGPADGAAADTSATSGHTGSAATLAYARPGSDVRTTPALPVPASDPTDTKIHPSLVPPPASRKDRRAATARNVALLAWGLYLLLLFVLPDAWLYRPSLHAVDALFWWLVPLVGKWWTVAAVAAVVAVSTMVLQRVLTDNARLREAKRRAAILSRDAAGLPPESPRRLAINRLTAPVQARVLGAAMVPLAVGLGPMVLTFLWMPARMDPASWSPPPNLPVTVVATVEGLRPGEAVQLAADPAVRVEGPPVIVVEDVAPATAALKELLAAWEARPATRPGDKVLAEVLADLGTDQRSPAELRAALAAGLKPRAMNWTVVPPPTDPHGGRWPVAVVGPDGSVRALPIVLGDGHPPADDTELPPARAGQPGLKLSYRRLPPQPFWVPLPATQERWARDHGWKPWDAGWLGVYLLAYLPAMFAAKRVLGVA